MEGKDGGEQLFWVPEGRRAGVRGHKNRRPVPCTCVCPEPLESTVSLAVATQ